MIAQATAVVTNLVSAAEEVTRPQHNDKLVGVSVFTFLVVCLMICLSFNRDR
jgi:multisubunit Na+/H+ antiporter MnhF subunit